MIDKVIHDPISVGMLKVNGSDVIKIAEIEPGPKIGWIMKSLMNEVLDNPDNNNKDYLEKRIKDLSKLSEDGLKKIAEECEKKIEEFEEGVIKELKKKHKV
jgi:hypothetical protein